MRARFHLSLKIIASTKTAKQRTKYNKKNLSNIYAIEKFILDTLNGAVVLVADAVAIAIVAIVFAYRQPSYNEMK